MLGRFPLSRVLLMQNTSYPWFILVPDHNDERNNDQLDAADVLQLLDRSVQLAPAGVPAAHAEYCRAGNVVRMSDKKIDSAHFVRSVRGLPRYRPKGV